MSSVTTNVMKMPAKHLVILLFQSLIAIVCVSRVESLRLLGLPASSHLPTSSRRVAIHSYLSVVGGGFPIMINRRRPQSANAVVVGGKSRIDGYAIQTIDGKEWIEVLTSGQYYVLRQGGTEPPSSSPLVSEKRRGVYVCAGCVAPLFDSTTKFDSGTGWPSFALPRSNAVETLPSFADLLGSEVRCQQCGGHLGDVYSDGTKFPNTPAELTGNRYCINGAALVFVPSEETAEPIAGDGLSGRKKLFFNKKT